MCSIVIFHDDDDGDLSYVVPKINGHSFNPKHCTRRVYLCWQNIKKYVIKVNYWGEPERAPRLWIKRKIVYIYVCVWCVHIAYRPYPRDHLYYIIHFQMAKVHKSPLAAVCTAVGRQAWKEVSFGSFDSPRPQAWWDCRKKVLNDRNGRRQLIVVLVEVGSLLLLPKVATAGKSIWMVYLLGSELGLLLRHGNPYCTLRPLPSFTAIWL